MIKSALFKTEAQASNKDKGGRVIDDFRINKYEAMCHYMIRKFLPALALWEASMNYEDLLNQLRYEVFMALKNKFDPKLAMTTSIKDPKKAKAQLAKKKKDPEAALEAAEKAIVYGRLKNYMRRTRYKYHPDQRGGKSISMDQLMEGLNPAFRNSLFVITKQPESADLEIIKVQLLEILDEKGEAAAKEMFSSLPSKVQTSVIEVLLESDEVDFINSSNGSSSKLS